MLARTPLTAPQPEPAADSSATPTAVSSEAGNAKSASPTAPPTTPTPSVAPPAGLTPPGDPQTNTAAVYRVFVLLLEKMPWILVTALVGFGIYKFYQIFAASQKDAQSAHANAQKDSQAAYEKAQKAMEDAYKEAHKTYETSQQAANKEMRDTYNGLGTMSKQMIENMTAMLTVQQNVTRMTETQRVGLADIQSNALTQQLATAAAIRAADQATAELMVQKQATEGAKSELLKLVTSRDERRAELDRLDQESVRLNEIIKKANEDASITLLTSAGDIAEVKSNLQTLAELSLGDDANKAKEFARKILSQFVTNQLKWLAEFATNSSATVAAKLRYLISTPESVLTNDLAKLANYSDWTRVADTNGGVRYVGVARRDATHWENPVSLTVSSNSIVNVFGRRFTLIVNGPHPRTWISNTIFLVENTIEGRWKADDANAYDEMTSDLKTGLRIKGDLKPPEPLSLSQFQTNYPAAYNQIATNPLRSFFSFLLRRDDLSSVIAMSERARQFKPAQVDTAALNSAPPGLKEQLLSLLKAAVARDAPAVARLCLTGSAAESAGSLAAQALQPGTLAFEAAPTNTVVATPAFANATAQTAAPALQPETYTFSGLYKLTNGIISARFSVSFVKDPTAGAWLFTSYRPVSGRQATNSALY